MAEYKLRFESTLNPNLIPFDLILSDINTNSEAIAESESQLNIMTCDGGFPFDEEWPDVKCTLFLEEETIWTDSMTMVY